jgi:hypothetical protein
VRALAGTGAHAGITFDRDQSGKVRGILCEPCNGFLGAFHDDPILLEAAARYLEEHGS